MESLAEWIDSDTVSDLTGILIAAPAAVNPGSFGVFRAGMVF